MNPIKHEMLVEALGAIAERDQLRAYRDRTEAALVELSKGVDLDGIADSDVLRVLGLARPAKDGTK